MTPRHSSWYRKFTAIARCLAGYVLASIASGVIQVSFVLPPLELLGADSDRQIAAGIWLLLATLHSGIFGAPFALVAIVVAEWKGFATPVYYVGAGLAIAALGFLAQVSGHGFDQPLPSILYVLTAFLAAGLSAGFVYWSVSGRHAGKHLQLPPLSAAKG